MNQKICFTPSYHHKQNTVNKINKIKKTSLVKFEINNTKIFNKLLSPVLEVILISSNSYSISIGTVERQSAAVSGTVTKQNSHPAC